MLLTKQVIYNENMIDEMPVTQSGRELPRFSLRQEELPEIRAWEVNSKHYVILKVEMISKRNEKASYLDDSSDKDKMEGTFQVLNIKPLGDKPVDAKELEQKDFEKLVARARSGKV